MWILQHCQANNLNQIYTNKNMRNFSEILHPKKEKKKENSEKVISSAYEYNKLPIQLHLHVYQHLRLAKKLLPTLFSESSSLESPFCFLEPR